MNARKYSEQVHATIEDASAHPRANCDYGTLNAIAICYIARSAGILKGIQFESVNHIRSHYVTTRTTHE
ncbi:MAG: hypothetical protein AAFQ52_15135 [Chloroflexota bacterium]